MILISVYNGLLLLQNSQISFSAQENATPKKPTTLTEAAKQKELSRTEENVTPKKPTSLTEAAKQKELSRTVQTESDSKSKKKQISNSKTKATSGHDIFASPPPPSESQTPRRSLAAAQQEEVKGNKNMDESAPRSSRASAKASNVSSSGVFTLWEC